MLTTTTWILIMIGSIVLTVVLTVIVVIYVLRNLNASSTRRNVTAEDVKYIEEFTEQFTTTLDKSLDQMIIGVKNVLKEATMVQRGKDNHAVFFPEHKRNVIKGLLQRDLPVYTICVDKELGKYKEGDQIITPWDDIPYVDVIKVTRITSVKQYMCYDEVLGDIKEMLKDYPELDVIELMLP